MVPAAGIRTRYLKPRCPKQNGKVERSHRIGDEEFWHCQDVADAQATATALLAWNTTYPTATGTELAQLRSPGDFIGWFTSYRHMGSGTLGDHLRFSHGQKTM